VTVVDDTTVLVIDDDATWRVTLEWWLERGGFRVVGLSQKEWLTRAAEPPSVDVVVVDIHVPGLDGLEVLTLLRRRWPNVPVIVTTAFGGADVADLARRRGATGYLEKPFRMAELITELRRVGGRRRCPSDRPEA
jgi:DNA-binding NtrC family response regulator